MLKREGLLFCSKRGVTILLLAVAAALAVAASNEAAETSGEFSYIESGLQSRTCYRIMAGGAELAVVQTDSLDASTCDSLDAGDWVPVTDLDAEYVKKVLKLLHGRDLHATGDRLLGELKAASRAFADSATRQADALSYDEFLNAGEEVVGRISLRDADEPRALYFVGERCLARELRGRSAPSAASLSRERIESLLEAFQRSVNHRLKWRSCEPDSVKMAAAVQAVRSAWIANPTQVFEAAPFDTLGLTCISRSELAQFVDVIDTQRRCDQFRELEMAGARQLVRHLMQPHVFLKAVRRDGTLFELPNSLTASVARADGAFEDGTIRDLRATCLISSTKQPELDGSTWVFENDHPIAVQTKRHIRTIREPLQHTLSHTHNGVTYYLDVWDVIDYWRRPAGTASHAPMDGVFSLTRENPKKLLTRNPFRSAFDVRLYGDVTGLRRDNRNRVFFVEGELHSSPKVDRLGTFEGQVPVTVLDDLALYGRFGFAEEEQRAVVGAGFGFKGEPLVKPLDTLLQYRWQTGVRASLLTIDGSNQRLTLAVGMGWTLADVDTAAADTTDAPVLDVDIWHADVDLRYRFYEGQTLDLEFGAGIAYATILEGPFDNADHERVFRFEGGISIHPGRYDRSKSVFLRARHFYASEESTNSQILIGYSTPITQFLRSGPRPEPRARDSQTSATER